MAGRGSPIKTLRALLVGSGDLLVDRISTSAFGWCVFIPIVTSDRWSATHVAPSSQFCDEIGVLPQKMTVFEAMPEAVAPSMPINQERRERITVRRTL
jgi:hypothetical protein